MGFFPKSLNRGSYKQKNAVKTLVLSDVREAEMKTTGLVWKKFSMKKLELALYHFIPFYTVYFHRIYIKKMNAVVNKWGMLLFFWCAQRWLTKWIFSHLNSISNGNTPNYSGVPPIIQYYNIFANRSLRHHVTT